MQGWSLVVDAVGSPRRPTPGGHVLEPVVAFDRFEPALSTGGRLLQSAGRVGAMVVAGLLLVVLGLAAVFVWQAYGSALLERVSGDAASTGSEVVEPTGETAAETGATEVEPEPAEPTDRDVVVDLLEDNDGRMKQARIVDATGWSKSKVSMLLSEMEEDGEITKLRVGRENIVSLSGNEPDAAGSPFDSQ